VDRFTHRPSVTVNPPGFLSAAQALAGAVAVGLLVGLERGWRDRDLSDGGRVAGLRTFGLIGLLGGMLGGMLAMDTTPVPFAVGLAAVALLFGMSYRHASVTAGTLSITTAVAGLVTFALGAVAARGEPMLAIAAAVGRRPGGRRCRRARL
jgi:amino acid transporter